MCHISFLKRAVNNTVRYCQRPYKEVCLEQQEPPYHGYNSNRFLRRRDDNEVSCRSYFETRCTNVLSATPSGRHLTRSGCWKEPRRVCARSRCSVLEGEEECQEAVVGATVDEPEEQCHLQPNRVCRKVTR